MSRSCLRLTLFVVTWILLASCVSSSYTQLPSVNYSFRVKSLIMHFTAIDYQRSVEALVEEGWVSSHYLIPESNDPSYPHDDLRILQLVDENERAWHAGVSYWQGRTGLNDSSIGIEIVNVPQCFEDEIALAKSGMASRAEHGPNRLCIFPDYDPKQIELLIKLSQDILARNPDISPTAVIGHSDIAPSRKNDPGPRFPWYQLYEAGIGAWYDEDTVAKYWQQFNQNMPSLGLIQSALRHYGYGIIETGINDRQSVDTLSAFQMHFLPWQVSGQADSASAASIFALIEKYFPDNIEHFVKRYEEELAFEQALAQTGKQSFDDALEAMLSNVPTRQLDGLVNTVFPNALSSSRELVNNRASFKAAASAGTLMINSLNAASADIYINEQKLNLGKPFSPESSYEYSLAKRTHEGVNSIRIENIQPKGASLHAYIPYPEISNIAEARNADSPIADNSYDFSAVDKLIENDIEAGFPGAVLLVLHKGKVVKQKAYGYMQKYDENGQLLAEPEPMQNQSSFDLASNTKAFGTTLALMHLVSQGDIKLTDAISTYLPEYAGEGREARSVADLLSHASGYDSEVKFFDPDNSLGIGFHSKEPSATKDLLLTRVPFTHARRSVQRYSDTNFMILGLLIERVTDMSLDEYVESMLYSKLALSSLRYNPLQKGADISQIAATELAGNTRAKTVDFDGVRRQVIRGEVHDEKAFYSMHGVAGHAGLFGNAQDLAVLAQLLLNGGGYGDFAMFNEATLLRFTRPAASANSFGLGWRLASNKDLAWHFGPYASERAFGHTGWTGTATVIDPEHELAIILLTNKKHSPIVEQAFTGDSYETGRYGSVMSLVYEAIIEHQSK